MLHRCELMVLSSSHALTNWCTFMVAHPFVFGHVGSSLHVRAFVFEVSLHSQGPSSVRVRLSRYLVAPSRRIVVRFNAHLQCLRSAFGLARACALSYFSAAAVARLTSLAYLYRQLFAVLSLRVSISPHRLRHRAFVVSPSRVRLRMRACIVVRSWSQHRAFDFARVSAAACVPGVIVARSSSLASLHRGVFVLTCACIVVGSRIIRLRASSHASSHCRAFVVSSSCVRLGIRRPFVVSPSCVRLRIRLCIVVLPLAIVVRSSSHASLHSRAFVVSCVRLGMCLCIVLRLQCHRLAFVFACVASLSCVRGVILLRLSCTSVCVRLRTSPSCRAFVV